MRMQILVSGPWIRQQAKAKNVQDIFILFQSQLKRFPKNNAFARLLCKNKFFADRVSLLDGQCKEINGTSGFSSVHLLRAKILRMQILASRP